jgi:hypothetical protein
MPLCRFGDLVVESDLPLDETVPEGRGPATCRVRVVPALDEPPAIWAHHWRSPDGAVAVSYAPAGERHCLAFPGLAEFVVAGDGSEIWCRPQPRTPESTLRHLLLDQVLPRAISLGARLVLHGGAISDGAGAHVLVGISGAGKSTLCAALAESGLAVLGDDCAIVERGKDGEFLVRSSYPGIRLRPDALDVLASCAATAPVAHYTPKRRLTANREPPALDALPLLGLYVLDTERAEAFDAAPLRGVDAYVAILSALFQLDLDGSPAARRRFELVGALARQVPIHRLRYPRSFAALDGVVQGVRALFRPR